MRASFTAIAAVILFSVPIGTANAQLIVGGRYMYNEIVPADSARADWLKFKPVGSSGGLADKCLSYGEPTFGFPDRLLYAPSWYERKSEMHLFYNYDPKVALSHVQIIRHDPPLPVRDSTSQFVIDGFTPLTSHTVFLVDLIDSTMIAYNRIGGKPQRGVAGKISAVRDLPFVQETLKLIDESWALCQKAKPAK